MADTELRRWSESFRNAHQVPPALMRDVVRRQRGRAVAFASIALIGLGETGVGVALLLTDPSAHARWMAAFLIGTSLAIAAVFLVTQRGLWRASAGSASALFELLERRVDAGLRITRVIPWLGTVAAVAVTALVLTAEVGPEEKARGVAFAAATLLFTTVVPRLARRRLVARRSLLLQWRAEL